MPATPPDELQQLQLDIAAKLGADELFEGVQVIVSRPREGFDAVMIENSINNALAGYVEVPVDGEEVATKAGLCVVVMMGEGAVPQAEQPGPGMELIQALRVIEVPMVNMGATGTQITAEQCALNILATLHLFNPGYGVLTPIKAAMKEVFLKEADRVSYDVRFRKDLSLEPRWPVQRPILVDGGPFLTMTCGTVGAAIWYSTDGTLPTPATGTLYSGQVDVGEFVGTIRAVAYLAGRRASDVAFLNLT